MATSAKRLLTPVVRNRVMELAHTGGPILFELGKAHFKPSRWRQRWQPLRSL